MKQEEAKREILAIWFKEPEDEIINPAYSFLFYHKLKKERPDLFNFKFSGDEWQTVSGWLQERINFVKRLKGIM